MKAYIARRILAVIPVMVTVGVLVFVLLRIFPGDVARSIVGIEASRADVEAVRESLGLNDPVPVQFVRWVGRLVRGDLGTSYISNERVISQIAARAGPTLSITFFTELVVVIVAVPVGVLAAWRAGSIVDRGVMVFAALGFSVPVFWVGFILIFLFGTWAFGRSEPLLPVFGYEPLSSGLVPYLRHLALPVAALCLGAMALLVRITRASTLGVLNEDYVRTARAKGLAEDRVLLIHVFRNAALPVATIIGLQFAGLLTGVVITESVFAIPGMGRYVVAAMASRDYPIIEGTVLIVATGYVLINLGVDIFYAYLDPRIRY